MKKNISKIIRIFGICKIDYIYNIIYIVKDFLRISSENYFINNQILFCKYFDILGNLNIDINNCVFGGGSFIIDFLKFLSNKIQ